MKQTIKPRGIRQPKEQSEDDRIFEYDLLKVASHEAGHSLVARQFGLTTTLRLWRANTADHMKDRTVRGQCAYDRTTAFRKCCIGWGGEVGEAILWEDADFHAAADVINYLSYNSDISDYSETDQEAIGSHEQTTRALKLTATVLWNQQAELRQIVERARMRIVSHADETFTIHWQGR